MPYVRKEAGRWQNLNASSCQFFRTRAGFGWFLPCNPTLVTARRTEIVFRPVGTNGHGREHARQSASVQNHLRTTERASPQFSTYPGWFKPVRCCRPFFLSMVSSSPVPSRPGLPTCSMSGARSLRNSWFRRNGDDDQGSWIQG